jgi:hypothetical protein
VDDTGRGGGGWQFYELFEPDIKADGPVRQQSECALKPGSRGVNGRRHICLSRLRPWRGPVCATQMVCQAQKELVHINRDVAVHGEGECVVRMTAAHQQFSETDFSYGGWHRRDPPQIGATGAQMRKGPVVHDRLAAAPTSIHQAHAMGAASGGQPM